MTKERYNITGNSTFSIGQAGNLVPITDFANGDNFIVTFPNQISQLTKGKDRNAIITKSSSGTIGEVRLRVLLNSPDDILLNNFFKNYSADAASFVLLEANATIRSGDGSGSIVSSKIICKGGVPTQYPTPKENQEGDVEQAVSEYLFTFANIQINKG